MIHLSVDNYTPQATKTKDEGYFQIAKERIEKAAQMAAGQFVDKRGKAGDTEDLPLFGVAN